MGCGSKVFKGPAGEFHATRAASREMVSVLTWAMTLVVIQCRVVLQIGLAVGDIAEVQKHALLKRIAMQVSVISTTQTVHMQASWVLRTSCWAWAFSECRACCACSLVHLWSPENENEKNIYPTIISAEELRNCLSLSWGQLVASRYHAGGCGER